MTTTVQQAFDACEKVFDEEGKSKTTEILADLYLDWSSPFDPVRLKVNSEDNHRDGGVILLDESKSKENTLLEMVKHSPGKLVVLTFLYEHGGNHCMTSLFRLDRVERIHNALWAVVFGRSDYFLSGTDGKDYTVRWGDDLKWYPREGPITDDKEIHLYPESDQDGDDEKIDELGAAVQGLVNKIDALRALVRAAVLAPGGAVAREAAARFNGHKRVKRKLSL
jgi:hypothetical protein